jgi:hypothetical protein
MRDKVQNDPLGQKVQASSSPKYSATLAAIRGYWKAYWKLALGMLLVVLLVVFVAQNANAIQSSWCGRPTCHRRWWSSCRCCWAWSSELRSTGGNGGVRRTSSDSQSTRHAAC